VKRYTWILLALAAVTPAQKAPFELEADRKPKTVTNGSCLIQHARVLTATGKALDDTDILVKDGKIAAIGRGLTAPAGTVIVDAKGKVVTPGLVDGHSHRGIDGTNEGSDSITAEVRVGDLINTDANNFWQAAASGHTSAMLLHGSANAIGGQSQVVKYKVGRPAGEAKIADAPRMIKFALGENVTRKNGTGNTTRFPATRMGVEAVYRRAFTEAKAYNQAWDDFTSGKSKTRPRRDLRLETLGDILKQKIWVQCHSYRSDEILMMVRLSQEFGFKIGAMQHALESYKIAPELAKAGVGVSIFEDEWSFKQEGMDAIPYAASILSKAGVNVSINTDGTGGTTALVLDAAKTMRYGGLTEDQALKLITINPARELGIDKRTGTIEVGKDADFAFWSGHPFSTYSKCTATMIEGEFYFERRDLFGVDASAPTKLKLDRKANYRDARPLPQATAYAIKGATVHPVTSKAFVGDVVVRDGKIAAVGTDLPTNGAVVVDGHGLHVYPGFIEGYTTMGQREIPQVAVTQDGSELGSYQPDLDANTNLWVESTHWGPALCNGVTNAFIGPTGGVISGQGVLANTDGYTTEQLGLKRKAALMVNLGGGFQLPDFCDDDVDASQFLGLSDTRQGDERLTDAQREQFFDMVGGAVQFQRGGGGGGTSEEVVSFLDRAQKYLDAKAKDPGLKVDLSMEAMAPYLKGEKPVVISARTAEQIRNAVELGKRYGLKLILRDCQEAWRETDLLRRYRVPVIIPPAGKVTLNANTTVNPWDPYDTPYAQAGLLAKAGVTFCFGSGEGAEVMNLPLRVGESCAYGLSVDDAIKALTLMPATIFGVADQLGSIEPGKTANLTITDGDPFELTSSVRYVFIQGTPRKLVSRHTMLRDKYSARL